MSITNEIVETINRHRHGFGSPDNVVIADLKAIGCTEVIIYGDNYLVRYEVDGETKFFIYDPRGRLFHGTNIIASGSVPSRRVSG